MITTVKALVAAPVKLTYDATLMKRARLLIAATSLLTGVAIYAWWNHPVTIDMAGYAPSDSLAYIEVNHLSDIVSGIAQTEAWNSFAPIAGSKANLQRSTWLSRIALWTGIGNAEEVILARSQFALVVVGLNSSEAQSTLLVRPSAALIIETHTTERRIRPAIEKRVAELARKVYPQSTLERKTVDGLAITQWVSLEGRSIVLAFWNSEAIVGNDEKAVLACIAVRRGTSKSLLSDPDLQSARARLLGDKAVAFGYVSTVGLGKLLATVAPLQVEGLSTGPQAQRILTGLAGKLFKSAAWALQFREGRFEDRYFLALPSDLADRLKDATASGGEEEQNLALFLPTETHSFTSYRFRDPSAAWRGLNSALSSRLDILGAVLVNPMLKATLEPYGINDPNTFFDSVRPPMITARMDDDDSSSVLIVKVGDEERLRRLANDRLGRNPTIENVGSYQVLVSENPDSYAAAFAEGLLIMGPAQVVRRCLLAKAQGSTLDSEPSFKRAFRIQSSLPVSVTYARDDRSTALFLSTITGSSFASHEDSLRSLPYASVWTTITNEGLERVTYSQSGLLGNLVAHFAPEAAK